MIFVGKLIFNRTSKHIIGGPEDTYSEERAIANRRVWNCPAEICHDCARSLVLTLEVNNSTPLAPTVTQILL